MTFSLFIEILGTLVGFLYLYWEYRASVLVWLAGVLMPALSLHVYWNSGLYADFGINVYYLLAAIYGWWAWKKTERRVLRENAGQGAGITSMFDGDSASRILWTVLAFVALYYIIGYVLESYTPSNVPWWDSFTTALSIVGMWMLARKWVEQWWVWLVVDVVSSGLYIYKGIYFYSALYGVYSVIAVFGYYEWKRLMTSAPRQ